MVKLRPKISNKYALMLDFGVGEVGAGLFIAVLTKSDEVSILRLAFLA